MLVGTAILCLGPQRQGVETSADHCYGIRERRSYAACYEHRFLHASIHDINAKTYGRNDAKLMKSSRRNTFLKLKGTVQPLS